ncbi:MAG: DNA ligase D [Oscillospiraceae bacterium]|nr:DNA ligase D [Oscillospiraceae bacterium]
MSDSLRQYNQKRDFSLTEEPRGKRGAAGEKQKLRFVVQHHIASRDHYDLRLEWNGALLSWAVPKGPSRNPADKRLAMRVEDHPLDYRAFEGNIPKGEYGGGSVMLWDEGTYEPRKSMEQGLREGALKFSLQGKRLKGGWTLIRTVQKDPERRGDSWLLVKERDAESAPDAGIGQYATSVRTGRTMEQIAAAGKNGGPAGNAEKQKNPFDRARAQLAKPVSEVPRGEDWLYEIKYDGYRILAHIEDGRARLLSRGGGDYAKKFQPAAEALLALAGPRAMVLDGEMIVAGQQGRPDFQALQSYLKNPEGKQLAYMIFDLLALDGEDLRQLPLTERKARLFALLEGAPEILQYSGHMEGQGDEMLRAACGLGLEGVIGKRGSSAYSGTRGGDWVKVKCQARQEFVIGGFTVSAKRSAGISSLLLGVYQEGELIYCGRASGFSERRMSELLELFRPIEREIPRFQAPPKPRGGESITWLRPKYAAEVSFAEWTREGLLRQAKFRGLRGDKNVQEIIRETPEPELNINLTNPDKIFCETPRITKKDLALYYQAVAGRMLPHIEGRLLSAIRCPGGSAGQCFFKKHPGAEDEGIETVEVAKSGGGTNSGYYVAGLHGLLCEVQRNTVELHLWGSRAESLERPDRMVFDLDPDEGMALDVVRQGVRDLKSVLDELGLKAFLKTSGGKGYHAVVPLRPAADWEAFRDFAKNVARIMERKWPERYVSTSAKASRKGKIFVDWMRNTRGATSAAPYSVRMREGMPVSMPIAWSELGKIAPDGISMTGALERLKRKDPWEGFFLAEQGIG